MKKLFILVLAVLVPFFALTGLSAASEKRLMDKASPKLMSGKVTQADEKTKTVTILGKDGEKVTLNFSDPKVGACKGKVRRNISELKTFPKVGDNVNVVARYGCAECLETC